MAANTRRTFLKALAALGAAAAAASSRAGRDAVPAPAMNEAHRDAGSATLFLCGDVMTGRGIDQVLAHPGDPRLYEPLVRDAREYVKLAEDAGGRIDAPVAADYVWGDAVGVLDRVAPDARIVNLETAVTRSNDHWPGKGIHYRMNPANVSCFHAAAIDCCVLANNHVLDWGYRGLEETLHTLHDAGIRTAGAGRDAGEASAPAVLPLPGQGRVLVFAGGDRSSGIPAGWAAGPGRAGIALLKNLSGAAIDDIAARIRAVRQPRDVVVFSVHWGPNWGYGIDPDQRYFAHRLIEDAGVDVVHGHSSHHPRGIEVHRGHAIFYGCGDFLNDYEGIGGHEEYRSELALMYFPRLDIATGELLRLDLVPMHIRRFRLQRASAEESRWLASTLNDASAEFGTRTAVEDGGTLSVRLNPAHVARQR